MAVNQAISSVHSDISSDISSDIHNEKPFACAKIGLLEIMIECNGDIMVKLSEMKLKALVKGGRRIQSS
jgi:hypothetical protein